MRDRPLAEASLTGARRQLRRDYTPEGAPADVTVSKTECSRQPSVG